MLSSLKKLFRVRPVAFGCDISDHSIRIAHLKEERGYLTLASYATHMLPDGFIANGVITDQAKMAHELRTAIASMKGERIHTPYVVASLPEPQCFLRIVQLPKLNVQEIGEAIKWEIEANVPLPIGEAYYDWEIAAGAQPDHVDVQVVVAPKNLVESYETLFSEAGLKPAAFEIDALSMARSVLMGGAEPVSLLLIDVAHHRTTFVIFAASMVRFTASVPVASKDLAPDTIQAFAKRIAEPARQYIDFFQTHSAHAHLPYAEVKRALLCGTDVHAGGLIGALSLELGLPVALANPWVNILRPPLKEVPLLPYKESLGYATALGLALRGCQEFL